MFNFVFCFINVVHDTLSRRLFVLAYSIPLTVIMPQSPLLWDAFAICDVPDKENRTCCGLTKRGTRCKLYVTEDVHKAGIKKLNALACHPFDLPLLQDRLHNIVPHFLCERWHRRLQANDVRERWEAAAIRNQAQAYTPRPPIRGERALSSEARRHVEHTRTSTPRPSGRPDLDLPQPMPTTEPGESSQVSGGGLTEAALRENRVPWNVSVAHPAVLPIEREDGGEVRLHLQSFRSTSSLRDESCGICRGEDQSEPVVLKCGRCTSYVHLGCMSSWLRTRWSESRSSCITWYVYHLFPGLWGTVANKPSSRYDGPFDAYYDTPTAEGLWAQRQGPASVTDHLVWSNTRRDYEQPPVPITPPAEISPAPAGASTTAARPSPHRVRQGSEHVGYPRLSTTSAPSNPPPLRRSDRTTRAPNRYEP